MDTNNLLYKEINKILNNNTIKPRKKLLKFIIHTAKHDIQIPHIESLETHQDFINNISDYILVNFKLPLGDFIKVIYPYRDNLELTVYNDGVIRRYKFVLMSDNVNMSLYTNTSQVDLNKLEYIHVEGQCIDRLVEILRTRRETGIFTNTSVEEVLKHTVLDSISTIKIDGKRVTVGLSVIKPHNKRIYEHITIPNGTKVIDVPSFLQNRDYGIYNGDVGIYYQQLHRKKVLGTGVGTIPYLFIYPLTNTDISSKSLKKLAIYKTPETSMNIIDNAFAIDGDLFKLVIDNASDELDVGDKSYMNHGEGFTTSEVNNVLNRPHKPIKDTSPSISYSDNIYNMKAKNRDDTITSSRYVNPTDNLYKERSKILKSLGYIVKFNCRAIDVEYLYPAMPVEYTFTDSYNKVITYNGTLHHVYDRIDHTGETMAIITIYVTKETK